VTGSMAYKIKHMYLSLLLKTEMSKVCMA